MAEAFFVLVARGQSCNEFLGIKRPDLLPLAARDGSVNTERL